MATGESRAQSADSSKLTENVELLTECKNNHHFQYCSYVYFGTYFIAQLKTSTCSEGILVIPKTKDQDLLYCSLQTARGSKCHGVVYISTALLTNFKLLPACSLLKHVLDRSFHHFQIESRFAEAL